MMEESGRQGNDSWVKKVSQGRLETGWAQSSATGKDFLTVRYSEGRSDCLESAHQSCKFIPGTKLYHSTPDGNMNLFFASQKPRLALTEVGQQATQNSEPVELL
jgi:hypothetical protein